MQQEQVQPLKEDLKAKDIEVKEATVKDGDGNTVRTEKYASITRSVEDKITLEQAQKNLNQLTFAKQQALDNIAVYEAQILANQVVIDTLSDTQQTSK